MKLTEESQANLDERKAVGRECIEVAAGDFPARAGVADDERETYGLDAVGDILTELFGPAGYMKDDGEEAHTFEQVDNHEAISAAEDFMRRAVTAWEGDAEDYIADATAAAEEKRESADDLERAADDLETFADVDGGDNVDVLAIRARATRLRQLAETMRGQS